MHTTQITIVQSVENTQRTGLLCIQGYRLAKEVVDRGTKIEQRVYD